MEKQKEHWGIKVDGIQIPGFSSQEEAGSYKKEKLQGKDAVVFQYQNSVSLQHFEDEDSISPGFA